MIRNCRGTEFGGGGAFTAKNTRISRCKFVGNSARIGGGVVVFGDSCIVMDCSFRNNEAYNGGGASVVDNSTEFRKCDFIGNKAKLDGGGLHADIVYDAVVKVIGSIFRENTALWSGGGTFQSSRSAVLWLENSVFVENKAEYGGGLYGARVLARGCDFVRNFAFTGGAAYLEGYSDTKPDNFESCVFMGNVARDQGGALLLDSYNCGAYGFNVCTFVGNTSRSGAWLTASKYAYNTDRDLFGNCCIAFNSGGSLVSTLGVTHPYLLPTLNCTDIYGNEGGDWISYLAPQAGINGNMSADPLFCDTAAGDFHLQGNSSCAPANNSCGVLIGALPVGCEWGCGDVDGSGTIDVVDAVHLVSYLFNYGSEPLDMNSGDVNGDGHLNIADVVYLINYIFIGGPAPCAMVG